MAFRYASHFSRWRSRSSQLRSLTLPRVWTAARIGLGLSVASYLATLNEIHGDSDEDSEDPAESAKTTEAPLHAGFTLDKTAWQLPIRFFGPPSAEGIIRMYCYTRCDNARIRVMGHGPRTLLSILEGPFVCRASIADVVQENLWFNIEALFKWYQVDHSTPQPVEFIRGPHPPPEAIQTVIKTSIDITDSYIMSHFLGRVFSSLTKKYAGDAIRATAFSCFISALYEADVRLLHVTSLGNMRGILGRPRQAEDGSVTYEVHVLSADHTPGNPEERARIEAAHPGENLFADGTLLGRPYTRCIGDGKLKWSTKVQTRLHTDYISAAPDPRVQTPPYISAQPDVRTIKTRPGDFLVLSSSWLTECLTNEEVVGLVGVWLAKNRDTHLYRPIDPEAPVPAPGVIILPEDLPVALKQDTTTMYQRWNTPKRFINTDVTPTLHLANNATGGADADLRETLLGLAPPESENNTNSLGIAVVFFQ